MTTDRPDGSGKKLLYRAVAAADRWQRKNRVAGP